MAKTKAVKWSIGADEPDDLQDFLSNEDILKKHTKKGEIQWPGKGPFTFKVKRLTVKPNKNGDDRISAMLVLNEPKDSDAFGWNGYLVWDGFNIVDGPALSFPKRFLKGLGLPWSDFLNKTKQDDQDPPHIVQIGKVKFEGAKDPEVRATVKVADADDYNDDEHWEIARYIPLEDEDGDAGSDDGEADEGSDVMSMDSAGDEDAADGDGASDDGEAWVRDDFDGDDFDTIAQVAEDDFGLKPKEFKALKKADDTEGLLDLMFGAAEPEPEPEKPAKKAKKTKAGKGGGVEPEGLRDELNTWEVKTLRKRSLKNDKETDVSKMKKAELVDLICKQETPPF